MIKYSTPSNNKNIKINIDEFLPLLKEKKAVLIDIRMPFEKKLWSVNFALDYTPEKLEKEYQNLPKDKLLVIACPQSNRSAFGAMFLIQKGFNAKYLEDGLIKLLAKLKGEEAKSFDL